MTSQLGDVWRRWRRDHQWMPTNDDFLERHTASHPLRLSTFAKQLNDPDYAYSWNLERGPAERAPTPTGT